MNRNVFRREMDDYWTRVDREFMERERSHRAVLEFNSSQASLVGIERGFDGLAPVHVQSGNQGEVAYPSAFDCVQEDSTN